MANRFGHARSLMLASAVTLSTLPSVRAAVTEKGEVRQPRNIYELVYSFEHTFERVLQGEELKQYRTMSPQEMSEKNPELYRRISDDVVGWTDEWISHVKSSGDQIPAKRLNDAADRADHIDAILRNHFETKRWPYRPMRVVFLPPRLFLDEQHRSDLTSGMFIHYYPGAFFVTVDWPVPIELVLVHESLHFNATGRVFGRPLAEGITETAARSLVLKYELLSAREVNQVPAYLQERKGVQLVLERLMERTSRSPDEALDLFVEAYLTGRQDEMSNVFGAESWSQILRLSRTDEDWQTHKIAKALGK